MNQSAHPTGRIAAPHDTVPTLPYLIYHLALAALGLGVPASNVGPHDNPPRIGLGSQCTREGTKCQAKADGQEKLNPQI